MADEQMQLRVMLSVGNITIAVKDEMLLAYRINGDDQTLVATFPRGKNDVGATIAGIFAAFMADMFPEGELTPELVDALAQETNKDAQALAEINQLKLFGQDVEIKH